MADKDTLTKYMQSKTFSMFDFKLLFKLSVFEIYKYKSLYCNFFHI